MKKINLFALASFVTLLIILLIVSFLLLTNLEEGFEDIGAILDSNDPAVLFKRVRKLLDKYDKPEVLEHAAKVMTMDPGELARMQLKI